MSFSRTSVIEILRSEFSDKEKQTKIKNKTLKMLEEAEASHGSASRIFDDCKQLLPQPTIDHLTEQFKRILAETIIHADPSELEKITLKKESDIQKFDLWIQHIALIGIEELLNDNGHIKREIVELFGWGSYRKKFGITDTTISILCGFVSRINQEVMDNASQEIAKNEYAYYALCNYLNNPMHNKENTQQKHGETPTKKLSNLQRIMLNTLDSQGFVLKQNNKQEIPAVHDVTRWPSERTHQGSLMVLAAIGVASSVMFFKKVAEKNSSCIEIQEWRSKTPESKSIPAKTTMK